MLSGEQQKVPMLSSENLLTGNGLSANKCTQVSTGETPPGSWWCGHGWGSWTSRGGVPAQERFLGNWFLTLQVQQHPWRACQSPEHLGPPQSFWVSRSKVGPIDMHFWQGHKGLRSFCWRRILWDGVLPTILERMRCRLDFMEGDKKTILKPQNMRNDGPEGALGEQRAAEKRPVAHSIPLSWFARDWKFQDAWLKQDCPVGTWKAVHLEKHWGCDQTGGHRSHLVKRLWLWLGSRQQPSSKGLQQRRSTVRLCKLGQPFRKVWMSRD